MLAENIIAVLMVQSETRHRAHLAGVLSAATWLVAIAATTISVSTLGGHDTVRKALVIAFVSAANYAGTVLGTRFGDRWAPDVRVRHGRHGE